MRYGNVSPISRATMLVAALSLLAGCEPAGSSSNSPAANSNTAGNQPAAEKAHSELSADELLDKMIAAYRNAKGYEDSGKVIFRVTEKGQEPREDRGNSLSVTFDRPNKLRLHAFEGIVVSDGDRLHATIRGLPEQILERPSPEKLAFHDLTNDKLLGQALGISVGFDVPQLRLLVSDDPLGDKSKRTAKRLKDEMHDGIQCHRVQITSEQGKSVYWLDHRTLLVTRYEFPDEQTRKQLDPEKTLEALEVIAEFDGAKFNPELPAEAFSFEPPKGTQLVNTFLPPPPQPPSPLLGQEIGDFSFVDMEGKKVDRRSLRGKVVVMDLWATWCHWCFKGFPNLEKIYQEFKKNDKVVVLAVNTDEADVLDSQVRASFEKFEYHVPIVRDTENHDEKSFKVEGLPTLYVLGPDGTLQVHEVGFKADLAEVLPAKIKRLLAGENLAKEAVAEYEKAREEYNKKAAEATIGATTVVELPQTKVAEKTEPRSFDIAPLWTTEGIKSPGNILVSRQAGGSPTILVVDGWRMVAEVDASGKVITKHELEIPESAAVSYLRSADDKDGKRYFAAFASGQQQVHLFDTGWKRLISYPSPDDSGQHAGISDVQLADLDGDGLPELNVGYWGAVGVQNASLEGQRLWSNRSIENVLRLAVDKPDDRDHRKLLCTNGRESIVTLDHLGKPLEPIKVASRALQTIVAADLDGEGPLELCGLVATEIGVVTAVGITASGEEMWNYPLPTGVHQVPIETVVAGQVTPDGPGQWLLPGADGSIHILGVDGKLIDSFNYGATLTGLAATVIDGTPVLLVSSAKGLSAWKVTLKK